MLNLHYLYLFFQVARWGGISKAVKKMPFSVSQPSMTRQMNQLEDQAGGVLFERRPFELTYGGERLYGVLKRFFAELKGVLDELRAGVPELVRIAASPIVLRDYLPPLLLETKNSFPGMRFTLKEGLQSQITEWFEQTEIDLAVTMLPETLPHGCSGQTLLRLPMLLLVPSSSPYRSAEEFWRQPANRPPLISPKADDAVTRCFRQGLERRGTKWEIGIEVNSIELVEAFVAYGFGAGISVDVPGRALPPGLRALPLKGFPPIQMGMLWRDNPNKLTQAIMSAMRGRAKEMRTA